MHSLLILPGDGIGPEVMTEVRRIIAWFQEKKHLKITVEEDLVGGASYDMHGTPLTQETLAKSLEVDAPWKLASRFKSRFIEANKSIQIELKFKQAEPTDCRLHIRLEVEELGVWTQFLAITSNLDVQ